MEVLLTDGMFGKGDKIADAETGEQALAAIYEWKKRESPKNRYKVEKYDRFIFGEDGSVAVDFGDYSSFFLIIGPGAKAEIQKALSFKEE